jgi:hypothetical protein
MERPNEDYRISEWRGKRSAFRVPRKTEKDFSVDDPTW